MSNTIELTDEQWKALQSGSAITITPPKKFELNDGCVVIGGTGELSSSSEYVLGFFRKQNNVWSTKKVAEMACCEQRIFNAMLQCWLHIVGEWRPNWEDAKQAKSIPMRESHGWCSIYTNARRASPFVFPTDEKCSEFIKCMESYLNEVGV